MPDETRDNPVGADYPDFEGMILCIGCLVAQRNTKHSFNEIRFPGGAPCAQSCRVDSAQNPCGVARRLDRYRLCDCTSPFAATARHQFFCGGRGNNGGPFPASSKASTSCASQCEGKARCEAGKSQKPYQASFFLTGFFAGASSAAFFTALA
jgi:hypothetical protein